MFPSSPSTCVIERPETDPLRSLGGEVYSTTPSGWSQNRAASKQSVRRSARTLRGGKEIWPSGVVRGVRSLVVPALKKAIAVFSSPLAPEAHERQALGFFDAALPLIRAAYRWRRCNPSFRPPKSDTAAPTPAAPSPLMRAPERRISLKFPSATPRRIYPASPRGIV